MSKFRVGEHIIVKPKEELSEDQLRWIDWKMEPLLGKETVIVCRIHKGHPYFRLEIDNEQTDWHEMLFKKRKK